MKARKTPRRSSPAAVPVRAAAPPSPRAPTYDDILAIARLVEAGSRFTEFRLRSGDIEVEVKRANGSAPPPRPQDPVPVAVSVPAPQPAAPKPDRTPDIPANTHVIASPMVGTFYRAPDPGAAPFVEVGAKVEPDTVVCIIEVMKLMNSVTAGTAGTVSHVFAENAQMVEHGQPLVGIEPR